MPELQAVKHAYLDGSIVAAHQLLKSLRCGAPCVGFVLLLCKKGASSLKALQGLIFKQVVQISLPMPLGLPKRQHHMLSVHPRAPQAGEVQQASADLVALWGKNKEQWITSEARASERFFSRTWAPLRAPSQRSVPAPVRASMARATLPMAGRAGAIAGTCTGPACFLRH